jgi:hypothetical protein
MAKNFLEKKIRNYAIFQSLTLVILILFSVLVSRFFYFNDWRNFFIGGLLATVGVISQFFMEHNLKRQVNYEKGNDLEMKIERKLKEARVLFKRGVPADYGDLDFFVDGKAKKIGIEAKNWDGRVTFENNILRINGYDQTGILSTLLYHCKIVKNNLYGLNSKNFIRPMLVFGYKTSIDGISQNVINFKGVEIVVVTIRDFDKFL